MSVAVVDTGTATYNTSATTQNYTFTVSSGATLAVFYIVQDATQTITSVTWDQGTTNQACTLVGSKSCPTTTNGAVYLYAVVNPTVRASGTLRVINGTATGTSAELQSYSGTNISSVAAACTNVLTANGTNTTSGQAVGTAAQSGVSGDMYVSAYVSPGAFASVNNTQIYLISPAGNDASGNRAASTGASVSLTTSFTTAAGAGNDWAAVSCDIKQPAAATQPTFNIDTSTPKKVTGTPQLVAGLNPNIQTNPFPIQVTDRLPAVWVPKTLPWPPQPLNINLFTNPFPFNQYDYSKPYFPIIRPYPQDGININLFTNPVPFNQYDWNKPFFPHFLPYPQDGINNNIFTNPYPILSFDFGRPYTPPNNPPPPIPLNLNLFTVTAVSLPFNQYDWSTTRWFTKPVPSDAAFNPNLFTNPFPFNQYDWPKPYFPVIRPYPQDGININIFTNPLPFNQIDWLKPFFPHFLPDPQVGININIFTNPVPFNQVDWSKPFFPKVLPDPQIGINANIFVNPFPTLNIDTPRPLALRGQPPVDLPYNQNLYTVVITAAPFNQTDWAVPTRARSAIPSDAQFNPNLFTNPFPVAGADTSRGYPLRSLPSADQPYNQNLYVVVVTAAPFNQTDWSLPVRPRAPTPIDQQFNPNLLTNPIPFNQTDFSPAHKLPQAPFDLSFALNLNIFTNPIPIFNFDYTPQHKPLPVPLDPNQGFNVLYQPVVTVTLLQRTLTGVGL